MEINNINVFQTDSKIINEVFNKNANYKIEYDNTVTKEYCAIYFASNFIYFPNDEETFKTSIIRQDRYEWVNQKVSYAHKHIFIRDIKKQWYLDGINSTISSPKKLELFLKEQTQNYKIILIGSSAGGYAAVLYGQLLNAKLSICFNAQFEIKSLLKTSNKFIDPLIFKYYKNKELYKYYDLAPFIKNPNTIVYFNSNKSNWDVEQANHIKELNIPTVFFNTSHHGIPFPKILLKIFVSFNRKNFDSMHNKIYNPILLSIQKAGFFKTVVFLVREINRKYNVLNRMIKRI